MSINSGSPSARLINTLTDWSLANRFLVVLVALVLSGIGLVSMNSLPLDAVPDLSDTQVIIRTDFPGQAPRIVEDQVTFPLSSQMTGLAGTRVVRGFSMFGTSFVYVVFRDGTDMYWARSRVLEALSQISNVLPDQVKPQLGPDATSVGWVFQYALLDPTGQHDLAALRSLQDWFLRLELASLEGVAEVASVGGARKEYQVLVNPDRLHGFGISLKKVIEAVRGANAETGGRTIEMAETEYMIHSPGYVGDPEDLRQAVLKNVNGIPVTVGDVARVVEGPALRRGVAELNGMGEVVGGIVIMRSGADAMTVIHRVRERLASIRRGLPEGVEIRTVYDRSTLIRGSVDYLVDTLLKESLMVALVTFLFLRHLRSAFVAVITLPLGIILALLVMNMQGMTANIMSLGGIAIAVGAMVDASIVMVENAHRKLANMAPGASNQEKYESLVLAMREVGPGIFFSLVIIAVSFLPVFALTGQSAKLFVPLAFTKTFAMTAAALLSVTLVPVLMLWLISGKLKREEENLLNRFFTSLYQPVLNSALKWRKTTLALALVIFASALVPASRLGSEFMPPLYEGSLMYMPMTVPGVSVAKAREILQVTNRQIMTVPEVAFAFGKAGRADTATDSAPLAMLETWIELKPRAQWRPGMTPEKLIAVLDQRVGLPGMRNSWGYPVKIRLDMLTTGIRTPIGIRVSGPDLKTIDAIAKKIETRVRNIPGTRSAIAERAMGGKYVQFVLRRRDIARHGLSVAQVQRVVQTALGGMASGEAVEGRERYAMMVRYDRPYREHVTQLDHVLVPVPSGGQVPLADLADIRIVEGPSVIKSENARPNGWVLVDIEGRDTGSYVDALRQNLKDMDLPASTTLKISGDFEKLAQAGKRLGIAVPVTLLVVVILLYFHFGAWDRTLLVLLSLPFGIVGGVWWIWIAGYHVSVAVVVGFIALAGVALETAIVMLIYLDQQMNANPANSVEDILKNVRRGAIQRLRPKLMTVGTILLGLVPVFLTSGPGVDVMRRIALPLVGGMISTLVLTLVLLPVLYTVYWVWKLERGEQDSINSLGRVKR